MFTRSEFRSATGLSRKALRIYEEKGILKPLSTISSRAIYRQEEVGLGKTIAVLRLANLSLDHIKRLIELSGDSENRLISELTEQLKNDCQNSIRAIDEIEKLRRRARSQVFRTRYGGFWAWGVDKAINEAEVCSFLSQSANCIAKQSGFVGTLSVRYSRVCSGTVRTCCFVESDIPADDRNPDLDWFYIPEQIYFGTRARGRFGNPSCFNDAYKRISHTRLMSKGRKSSPERIEVYEDFGLDDYPEKKFDAVVLS